MSNSQPSDLPSWKVVVCSQCIQCLSILPVCLLHLKQFLDSLESGFIGIDDLARQGQSVHSRVQDSFLSHVDQSKSTYDKEARTSFPSDPDAMSWSNFFNTSTKGTAAADTLTPYEHSKSNDQILPVDRIMVNREIEVMEEGR